MLAGGIDGREAVGLGGMLGFAAVGAGGLLTDAANLTLLNRVSNDAIEFDQPIRIGAAEIGNWGMPLKVVDQPVRNLIGRMDELTIWNVALNEEQISDMHAETRPRSC